MLARSFKGRRQAPPDQPEPRLLAKPPRDLTTPEDVDQTFLREVDEEVRRAELLRLWQRYGRIAVVAILLGLAALAGVLFWQERQRAAAGVAGEDLLAAMTKLEVGEGATARPKLQQLADQGPRGYRTAARLMLAADAAGGSNPAQAAALYDKVAADSEAPPALRDLATIRSVRIGFDTLPPATIISRLAPLAVPTNGWFAIAGEMTALAQLKAGKRDAARATLAAVARDGGAPASLRRRCAELARSLGAADRELQPPGEPVVDPAADLAPYALAPEAPAAPPAAGPPANAAPTAAVGATETKQ